VQKLVNVFIRRGWKYTTSPFCVATFTFRITFLPGEGCNFVFFLSFFLSFDDVDHYYITVVVAFQQTAFRLRKST